MKQWKKKIVTMLITGIPLLVFLACGSESKTVELADLQAEEVSESADESESVPVEAYVHICGEVISPGVYRVPTESRIYDVLLLAGGFTKEAADEAVNLAEPVKDGMQVIIPSEEEMQKELEAISLQRAGMVNINTASAEELCVLPGVGESRAADIIAYRNQNGAFATTEEIMQVPGIKEGLYEKIKSKIYIE